jgi:superfamily II DNA or RNA helicase
MATTATPTKQQANHVYNLLKWTTHDKIKGEVDERTFNGMFESLGQGTNAQDEALVKALRDTMAPYMAADQKKDRGYTVSRNRIGVRRSQAFRNRQKELEAGADKFISQFIEDNVGRYEKAGFKRRAIGKGDTGKWMSAMASVRRELGSYNSNNPVHVRKAEQLFADAGGKWRDAAVDKARSVAIERHLKQHRALFNATAISDKTRVAVDRISSKPKGKHIVYVDSADHRKVLEKELAKKGIKSQSLMVTGGKQAIADEWQRKQAGDTPVLFLSKGQAAGINIAGADNMHIVGNPDDATTLIQVIGRADRTSDLGKDRQHLDIHEYRYEDNPYEDRHWSPVDRQYKMLGMLLPATLLPGEEIKKL